jgi:hypothetical protein
MRLSTSVILVVILMTPLGTLASNGAIAGSANPATEDDSNSSAEPLPPWIPHSVIRERGPMLCHCLNDPGGPWEEGGGFISGCPCIGIGAMYYAYTFLGWGGFSRAACKRCTPHYACTYSQWLALSCAQKALGQEASNPPACDADEILVDTGYGCVKCLSMSCLGIQPSAFLLITDASWGRVKATYR